jgi:hypothetical protein
MRALHIGVLISLILCWSSFRCAADEARTIVVLDATAQMNAAMGQKRKLDWAKASIVTAASRLDPASSFALWSFGGNPQKKCEDKGELVPLQPASSAFKSLENAMAALSPKASRAPALGALEAALKSPGLADGKPVLTILIAGTGDDCVSDLCGTATRLHGAYPNAKLMVFGLNMSEGAAGAYSCAAKAMGGAFTAAKSGADLDKNLRQALNVTQNAPQLKAAEKLAAGQAAPQQKAPVPVAPSTDAKPAANSDAPAPPAVASAPALNEPPASAPAQPAPPAAEVRPASPPTPIEPNVALSATLASGSPPLDAGVTWEITKIQISPTGQSRLAEAPLWVGGGAHAKAKLPEGRYSAKLTYGLASANAEFAVAAGKVEKTIPLDAGAIAAEALQAPGGQPAEGAFFVLRKAKTGEELGRSSEAPAMFHVNAGEYVLAASAGLAKLDAPVKVVAGKVSVVRMAMNVGALEIKTFAAEGADKPIQAWHVITPLAQDASKAPGAAFRLLGASHRLQLPAGAYRLETIYGAANQESTVTVAAGQTISKTVILNVGEANISLPAGKSDKVCAVYEAGADRKTGPVGRAAGEDMRFFLKAGRYEVECGKKGEASPQKTAEIKVVAGEVQSAKIED